MDSNHYNRLLVIDEDYEKLGQEKLAELIEQGKNLIEQHGEEDLQHKLTTEAEMAAVGAYLDWKVAIDDTNYCTK